VVEEARAGGHGGLTPSRLAIAAGLAIEAAPARKPQLQPEPDAAPEAEAA
jgi:hypothetical protein